MVKYHSSMMRSRRQLASSALLALTASISPASCFSSAAPFVRSFPSTGLGLTVRGGSTQKNAKDPFQPQTSTTTSSLHSAVTEELATTSSVPTMTPAAKLEALRSKMKELDLDVYLVPSGELVNVIVYKVNIDVTSLTSSLLHHSLDR